MLAYSRAMINNPAGATPTAGKSMDYFAANILCPPSNESGWVWNICTVFEKTKTPAEATRIACSSRSGLPAVARPVVGRMICLTATPSACRLNDQNGYGYMDRSTTRSLSFCTGRLLALRIVENRSMYFCRAPTGCLITIQRTCSVHGGVVNDPE